MVVLDAIDVRSIVQFGQDVSDQFEVNFGRAFLGLGGLKPLRNPFEGKDGHELGAP